ncbi:MAG: Y-family DNA polymerase [Alphaproteobacteria bacterium]
MRKPETIEWLYLDFDGFFASVEQQIQPSLRGKPIGVTPFKGTDYTIVIACSKEAKARGVKNIMPVADAMKVCPELILVTQKPDYYRRAHNALAAAIESIIPIDVAKSIDELTCELDRNDIADPYSLTVRIKDSIRKNVGEYISCSIGYAANRHLAKIACKMDKPDGHTVWHPSSNRDRLAALSFDDIPGIGGRMQMRLWEAGIQDMAALMATQPKQMRHLWGNVTGERLWYALHGYAVKAQPSKRGMYGHGRVLPPEMRTIRDAYYCSRILLVKAARRMRRDGYYPGDLHLWAGYRVGYKDNRSWSGKVKMHHASDDYSAIQALDKLWRETKGHIDRSHRIVRVGIWFGGLVQSVDRQHDLFHIGQNTKWEAISKGIDHLNWRYGKTAVSIGPWDLKYGSHLGTKIAFTRIPRREDAI